ncbi:MAG: hypothetical protein KJN62_04165 [Deltaproteobacteria bacterium]|nr:hypothetical protein [Deltaproteobacteria bacterium]
MLPKTKRRERADLPNRLNFTGGYVDPMIGGEISRPYYIKKVVQFH